MEVLKPIALVFQLEDPLVVLTGDCGLHPLYRLGFVRCVERGLQALRANGLVAAVQTDEFYGTGVLQAEFIVL